MGRKVLKIEQESFLFFKDYHQHMVDQGLLTAEQLSIACNEQRKHSGSLREILLRMGFLKEGQLLKWFVQKLGYKQFSLSQPYPLSLVSNIPPDQAYRFKILPLSWDSCGHVLHAAFVDVLDIRAHDALRLFFPEAQDIIPYVGYEKEIIEALDRVYSPKNDENDHASPCIQEETENPYSFISFMPKAIGNEESEQFINQVLEVAVKAHASDIHFEPEDFFVRIRLRIAGILKEHKLISKARWPVYLSRLKILSGMNIAENRLPQSGRFSQYIAGREIDLRTASQPISSGENFVVRILDRLHAFFELEDLGFQESHVHLIKQQLEKPHGIFIVTGPTGSGKTTTLYSMLSCLTSSERNIMTLEDPIEYELPGIRQTQVSPEIGLTFAEGVRAILRQDPDIILIGEIRDEATASMALRASMTGHLVLTTLHANSALQAINRLIDLGVSATLLSGNINCILSQRLVRVQALEEGTKSNWKRRPVAEILIVTPELDTLLTQQVPQQMLLEKAILTGYEPMKAQAKSLIKQGIITVQEVKRVLALD